MPFRDRVHTEHTGYAPFLRASGESRSHEEKCVGDPWDADPRWYRRAVTANPDDRTDQTDSSTPSESTSGDPAATAPVKRAPAAKKKPAAKAGTARTPAAKVGAAKKPATVTKVAAEKAAATAEVVIESVPRADLAQKDAGRETASSTTAPTGSTTPGAGKPAAKSSTAKTAAVKNTAARTAPAKGSAAKTTATKTTAAKTAATKTTAAKTAAAKSAAAKSAAAKATAAKTTAKTAAAKAAATKAAAGKATAAKTTAAKSTARTAAAKTAAAKTAAAKKAAAAKAAAEKVAAESLVAELPSVEPAAPVAAAANAVPNPETVSAPRSEGSAADAEAPPVVAPAAEVPDVAAPEVVEPDVADPEVVEPEVIEPEVVEPEVVAARAPESAASEVVADSDATSASLAIRVTGLVKHFGDNHAVDGIDLVVPAGSFYGIVGPNGAGKTTTLSIVAGLLRADAGAVEICGIDQRADPVAAKRMMGVLPDRLRTFDRLTGRQLLYYYGLLRGLASDVIERRTADLARAFDLGDALGRVVSDYSAGMTKKIMLAGAMIHSPRVLVLDEPFEAVDPVSSSVILDILRAYVAHGGTVILSSHGMDLVERVCSRVAIIVGGLVLAEGTIDEVRAGQTLESRFVELAGSTGEVEGLEWLHTFSD